MIFARPAVLDVLLSLVQLDPPPHTHLLPAPALDFFTTFSIYIYAYCYCAPFPIWNTPTLFHFPKYE